MGSILDIESPLHHHPRRPRQPDITVVRTRVHPDLPSPPRALPGRERPLPQYIRPVGGHHRVGGPADGVLRHPGEGGEEAGAEVVAGTWEGGKI